MQEFYFHETVEDGGTRPTKRLRGVQRTTDDGYTIGAFIRFPDRAVVRLESHAHGVASDVLNAEERVSLAKLLLSGLPLDLVRNALPGELFTVEWALRTTDSDPAEIIGEPEGGFMTDRAAAEAAAADLDDAFEDPAVAIVRREITDWVEVN